MTKKDAITLAIDALIQRKGDDLYRAECAFRGMTDKQLKEQHGQSGKTRLEVLTDYRKHEERIKEAITVMNDLMPPLKPQ